MFQRIPAIAILFLATAHLAEAGEIIVTMEGHSYSPAEISASVGDTIRFVNDDADAHNVFVPTASHALDLGSQDPGSETVLTLRSTGRFEVECVLHSGMLTLVEVSE